MTTWGQRLLTAFQSEKEAKGANLSADEIAATGERMVALFIKEALAASKPKKPKQAQMSDVEWMQSLREDPAFTGLDVGREWDRCCAWYKQNVSKVGLPTRKRFTNWLLKAERVVTLKQSGAQFATGLKPPAPQGPEGWREWLQVELSTLSEDHPAHGQLTAAYNCRKFDMMPASWRERATQSLHQKSA